MGHCNISELKEFQRKLAHLNNESIDRFCRSCAREIAARLLAKTIKRTPVAKSTYQDMAVTDGDGNPVVYKRGMKKGQAKVKQVRVHTGGTLRRGWTGGVRQSPVSYANSLGISCNGQVYSIEIINGVEYAPYVEFGHMQTPGRFVPAIGKSLKAGWVDGKFMLTISVQDMQRLTPRLIEKRLNTFLKEAFHD